MLHLASNALKMFVERIFVYNSSLTSLLSGPTICPLLFNFFPSIGCTLISSRKFITWKKEQHSTSQIWLLNNTHIYTKRYDTFFTVVLLPVYSLRVKLMYMWGKPLPDIILEEQFKQLVEHGFQYDNWEAMEYNFTSHGTRKNPSNTFLNFPL